MKTYALFAGLVFLASSHSFAVTQNQFKQMTKDQQLSYLENDQEPENDRAYWLQFLSNDYLKQKLEIAAKIAAKTECPKARRIALHNLHSKQEGINTYHELLMNLIEDPNKVGGEEADSFHIIKIIKGIGSNEALFDLYRERIAQIALDQIELAPLEFYTYVRNSPNLFQSHKARIVSSVAKYFTEQLQISDARPHLLQRACAHTFAEFFIYERTEELTDQEIELYKTILESENKFLFGLRFHSLKTLFLSKKARELHGDFIYQQSRSNKNQNTTENDILTNIIKKQGDGDTKFIGDQEYQKFFSNTGMPIFYIAACDFYLSSRHHIGTSKLPQFHNTETITQVVIAHLKDIINTHYEKSIKKKALQVLSNYYDTYTSQKEFILEKCAELEIEELNPKVTNVATSEMLFLGWLVQMAHFIRNGDQESGYPQLVKFTDKISDAIKTFPGFKIYSYLFFGQKYMENMNRFVEEDFSLIHDLMGFIVTATNISGQENPRAQELIAAYDYASRGKNPFKVYQGLCKKIRESEPSHHFTRISFPLSLENKSLQFEFHPGLFSHIPVSAKQLANLEDVKSILGDNLEAEIQGVLDGTNETNYYSHFSTFFDAPFTEEKIMLHALVQKYKTMGPLGKEKMIKLLQDMNQCKQGKNEAIWHHYHSESTPLPSVNEKDFGPWIARTLLLLKDEDISEDSTLHLPEFSLIGERTTRKKLSDYLTNMLSKNHHFGRHLRDLSSTDAKLLRGVFGKIASEQNALDQNDSEALKEKTKEAIRAMLKLRNKETFFQELTLLSHEKGVFLPANKFANITTKENLFDLIEKLRPEDVEGRGHFEEIKTNMRQFVESSYFQEILNGFQEDESGKLRTILSGFVSNGWAIGLLNLCDAAKEGLKEAITQTYSRIFIDGDLSISHLEEVLHKEIERLKREAFNRIVEEVTKGTHLDLPHDAWYIDGLIGSKIGLRNPTKMPDFDFWPLYRRSTINLTPQNALDMFHATFTPQTLIDEINTLIRQHKISVIDPIDGHNKIWVLLASIVKPRLEAMGYDPKTIELDDLIFPEEGSGATDLAIAILLEELGILKRVEEPTL